MESANHQTNQFRPVDGPLLNPLMGWAPRASANANGQPHSLVYVDLTWRDFEPQHGVFDFASFESKEQLGRQRADGQRIVFRFVCDIPGQEPHRDIPDWLYDATGGSGDAYDTSYGKGFSPDYSNQQFIQYHREAIGALGDRYGHDGFFAYVELGSLGHWGEWHVMADAGIRQLPPKVIRDQYVEHYREAFPAAQLLMRRPFSIARDLNLGLYNDLTGDPEGTNEWLGWIASGGEYNQTGEVDELVPMPAAWQTAPIGGEQTGARTAGQLYGSELEQTIELLEQSHATFIGPGSPAEIGPASSLQPGVDAVLSRIGYRLYVQQVTIPRVVLLQSSLDVRLILANDGIAPFYFDWPSQLSLSGQDGKIYANQMLSIDLRKVLPGRPYTASLSIPLQGLPNGSYQLGFAILDPLTQRPAVRLAMESRAEDLIQVLGTVEVLGSPR
jgi:hypothetical protein